MNNPKAVGAPTELTEDLKLKIRDMVIEGIEDITIAEKLNVPINTFKSWKARNYHSFADNYEEWKISRLGQKALGNVRANAGKYHRE